MKRISARRSKNFTTGIFFLFIFVSLILTTGRASAEPPPLLIAQLIARIEALETTVGEQEDLISRYEDRIAGLEAKLANVRIVGDIMLFEGVNVQVVNGLGETNTTNGLGNLIVGYNSEGAGIAEEARGGSHNVIIGDGYEYREYSKLGTKSIVTHGDLQISSAGKMSLESGNNFMLAVGEEADLQAGTDVKLNAGRDVSLAIGRDISLVTESQAYIEAGNGLNLQAKTVNLNTDEDLNFTLGGQAIIKAQGDITINSSSDLVLKGSSGGTMY